MSAPPGGMLGLSYRISLSSHQDSSTSLLTLPDDGEISSRNDWRVKPGQYSLSATLKAVELGDSSAWAGTMDLPATTITIGKPPVAGGKPPSIDDLKKREFCALPAIGAWSKPAGEDGESRLRGCLLIERIPEAGDSQSRLDVTLLLKGASCEVVHEPQIEWKLLDSPGHAVSSIPDTLNDDDNQPIMDRIAIPQGVVLGFDCNSAGKINLESDPATTVLSVIGERPWVDVWALRRGRYQFQRQVHRRGRGWASTSVERTDRSSSCRVHPRSPPGRRRPASVDGRRR